LAEVTVAGLPCSSLVPQVEAIGPLTGSQPAEEDEAVLQPVPGQAQVREGVHEELAADSQPNSQGDHHHGAHGARVQTSPWLPDLVEPGRPGTYGRPAGDDDAVLDPVPGEVRESPRLECVLGEGNRHHPRDNGKQSTTGTRLPTPPQNGAIIAQRPARRPPGPPRRRSEACLAVGARRASP